MWRRLEQVYYLKVILLFQTVLFYVKRSWRQVLVFKTYSSLTSNVIYYIYQSLIRYIIDYKGSIREFFTSHETFGHR